MFECIFFIDGDAGYLNSKQPAIFRANSCLNGCFLGGCLNSMRKLYKGCLNRIIKMFGWFGKSRRIDKLEKEIHHSFNSVKDDFNKVSKWIQHIDGKHKGHDEYLDEIKEQILVMKADLQEVKDFIAFFGPQISKQPFKHPQTAVGKQTAVEAVQTPVQTAVQTSILQGLTVMERAIVWALLNTDSDMKLSYEDLAALLGKDKSTIRGQVNTIRQKSEGLIEEHTETNGKKRVFIPEKMRVFLLKNVKVRVKSKKKEEKEEDFEQNRA